MVFNLNSYQCINIKDMVENNYINNGQTQKQKNTLLYYI